MIHRISIASTLALALLAPNLAGCATPVRPAKVMTADEAKAAVEARRVAFPLADEDLARIGYRLDWVGYPDVGAGEHISSINVGADVVTVQDTASTVTALEPGSGSKRWSFQLGNRLVRFRPLARMGDVVVASSDAEVFLLRADDGNFVQGESKYTKPRQAFARIVSTPPVIIGNTLIYGSAGGEIFAHSLDVGMRRWDFAASGPVNKALVRAGDTVAGVSQSGQVVFLDPSTGGRLGSAQTFAGIDTDPIAVGNTLVLASRDQSLYCFDTDGRQVWRYRTPFALTVQPSADTGVVYCEIPGQGLTAINAVNGAVIWKSPEAHGTVFASRKGRLLAFDGKMVYAVDHDHGDVIEAVNFEYADQFVPDKFANGTLYAVSKSGLVAKLVVR